MLYICRKCAVFNTDIFVNVIRLCRFHLLIMLVTHYPLLINSMVIRLSFRNVLILLWSILDIAMHLIRTSCSKNIVVHIMVPLYQIYILMKIIVLSGERH